MKTSTLLAAIALTFAASAAVAQEATYDYPQQITSQKTRAAVIAEVEQARADGTLQLNREVDSLHRKPFVSTLTRAEVKARTLAAIASGEVAYLNRENNDFQARFQAQPAPTQMAAK